MVKNICSGLLQQQQQNAAELDGDTLSEKLMAPTGVNCFIKMPFQKINQNFMLHHDQLIKGTLNSTLQIRVKKHLKLQLGEQEKNKHKCDYPFWFCIINV